MENQHRRITGYRDLSEQDINLINAIKQAGKAFEVLDNLVAARIREQFNATNAHITVEEEEKQLRAANGGNLSDIPSGLVRTPAAEAEFNRLVEAQPHRWRSIATTHMQQALMALTRAVAQPSSF